MRFLWGLPQGETLAVELRSLPRGRSPQLRLGGNRPWEGGELMGLPVPETSFKQFQASSKRVPSSSKQFQAVPRKRPNGDRNCLRRFSCHAVLRHNASVSL